MIKIILKKNKINLGKKYDLLKVKSGYALNYLIPNKYAIIATKSQIKINKEVLKQIKNKEKILINKYNEYINLLKNKYIHFKKKITDNIFLVITKKDILKKIKKLNIFFKKKDINIKNIIIKKYGEYKINFTVLNNINGYINIIINNTK